MNEIIFFLILLFVIINIVQTWLVLNYKLLIKGAAIVGGMEAIEFPLVIYLIIRGGVEGFLMVVIVEIIQWLVIAYSSTKSRI